MKVLVVDGPCQGEIHRIETNRYFMPYLGNGGRITYYVHNFHMCGRTLWIASVNLNIDSIDQDNVFALIVSDRAKQVAVMQ